MSKTRVVHVSDNVPGAVYIGRRNNRKRLPQSRWANPYAWGKDCSREAVIANYAAYIDEQRILHGTAFDDALRELAGKPLACWCRHDGEERTLDNACHGDVLVELIRELGLEN